MRLTLAGVHALFEIETSRSQAELGNENRQDGAGSTTECDERAGEARPTGLEP